MEDCIELKAGIKQFLDCEVQLICIEHIQHKVRLDDLFERAKAEAYAAGRAAGMSGAVEAVYKLGFPDAIAEHIVSAIEALGGGE